MTIGIVCSLALASCAGAATFNQVLDRWSKSVKYIDREDDISNLEIEATYYSAEFIEAYIQREAENNLWTKQEADDYKYKFLQALRLDEMIPIQVKFINNGPTMHLGPFDIMVKLIIFQLRLPGGTRGASLLPALRREDRQRSARRS